MPVNTDGSELSGVEHRLTALEIQVETLVASVKELATRVASVEDMASATRMEMAELRSGIRADVYKALYGQTWRLYAYGAGLVGVAYFIGRYVA